MDSVSVPLSELEIRDRLVGTWKLISAEQTLQDGATRPYPRFGPRAKGILIYSRDGYMSATMANPDIAKWADENRPTDAEKIAAADGTFAYCGRYEIDVQNSRLIHLPEVATWQSFVGTRQIRPYTFENERLILSDTETQTPGVVRWTIVWQKVLIAP